jgi:TPR repeat protein
MNRSCNVVLTVLTLAGGIAGSAVAGPYEDGTTAFERGDYETAVRDWRPLANKGFAGAQFGLGVMYANGNGVPPDYEAALNWFRKAADKGYPPAQFELGRLYVNGHGVGKDYAVALSWFRKAADQSYADGQFALGVMYENGQGVVQAYATAASWYRKAADQGNATAQYALGILYSKGDGVPKDLVSAYMWFDLAAAHSDKLQSQISAKSVADYRDTVAESMSKAQVTEAQTRARLWKSDQETTKPSGADIK